MNSNNTPYDLPIIPFSSNPTKEDSDEDGINDIMDTKPLLTYSTKALWQIEDEEYSTPIQSELLMLHLFWKLAETDNEKQDLEDRANEIREEASTGIVFVLDQLKIILGAAADEFS